MWNPIHRVIQSLGRKLFGMHNGYAPRDLRRELREQYTEGYWRQRQSSEIRRYRLLYKWQSLLAAVGGLRYSLGILSGALPTLLKAFVIGCAFIVAVLMIERTLTNHNVVSLIPSGDSAPPVGAFPTLAVQVSASLLGFYLASVGIVLGSNSYHNVSTDIRDLILGNDRTKLYLRLIGTAIGIGLVLVFLGASGFAYGYMTLAIYALLVSFSGWAFWRLAFGVFNLFNPIELSKDLLRMLHKAIVRIDAEDKGETEIALRTMSIEANNALYILSEIMEIISKRNSFDNPRLASTIEKLLTILRLYARRKHFLTPQSKWFPEEAVYPKWGETDWSQVSMALRTSTPLQPSRGPDIGWLEKRSAELASVALEACVFANDRNSALRIISAIAATTRTLAGCCRLDDAIEFAGIIRDRCRAIEKKNDTAVAVAGGPPLILSNLLLGWNDAIAAWDEEIQRVVDSTDWNQPSTSAVHIQGTARVWKAAQLLLRQVQDEHAIQGRRVTPDWYLRSELAGECTLSLREFADQLPQLLNEYVGEPPLEKASPEAKAYVTTQCLQTLAKAEQLEEPLKNALEKLKGMQLEQESPIGEFEGLTDKIRVLRTAVIVRLSDTLPKLRPEPSKSEPDLFGEALFRVVHHIEIAIRGGDEQLLKTVFPKVLVASLDFQNYAVATYRPPTYRFSAAVLDPVIDVLELSGLAMIYEVIRGDRSADPVRQVWKTYFEANPKPKEVAQWLLTVADTGFSFEISPRNIARTEWEMSLNRRIIEAGLARPEYSPSFGQSPQKWNAPTLIKILGVSRSLPSLYIKPHTVFAAEVIAPISGESDEELRSRRNLRQYYDERDRHSESEAKNQSPDTHSGETKAC